MHISMDGFHIAFKRGTGLSTYARQLMELLQANGHTVHPLFGLGGISPHDSNISYQQFLQSFSTRAEDLPLNTIQRRHNHLCSLFYLLKTLTHFPINATEIISSTESDHARTAARAPACSNLFNIPFLYRSANHLSQLGNISLPVRLPSHANIDLFHATSPLPIHVQGVPNIVTIPDIIPLMLPHSTLVPLKRYRAQIIRSIRHANLIFTISEHSKQDLIKFFHIPAKNIHVTYLSSNISSRYLNLTFEEIQNSIRRNFNLNIREYFIVYGAVEPRKNIARILQATMNMRISFPIVVVGKDGWLHDDVNEFLSQFKKANPQVGRFRRIHHLPLEQLMYLIKGARGLVFPSLYEGFGLPILEAMQMGCPVITARNSSLTEVAGTAAHYVDPFDIKDLAAAMDLLASNDEYCQELIQKGFEQTKKFGKELYLERLKTGYEMALNPQLR